MVSWMGVFSPLLAACSLLSVSCPLLCMRVGNTSLEEEMQEAEDEELAAILEMSRMEAEAGGGPPEDGEDDADDEQQQQEDQEEEGRQERREDERDSGRSQEGRARASREMEDSGLLGDGVRSVCFLVRPLLLLPRGSFIFIFCPPPLSSLSCLFFFSLRTGCPWQ